MTKLHRTTLTLAFAGLAILVLTAPAAQAQPSFEFYGGYHFSDTTEIDDSGAAGFRYTLPAAGQLGFEISLGWQDFQAEAPGLIASGDLWLVDFSAVAQVGSGPLHVFAGIGWANAEFTARGPFLGGFFFEDSFTANAGFALKIPMGSGGGYLRPDARVRWFDRTDDLDYETTLAFGFRF